MYNKQELIDAVKSELIAVYETYMHDDEIEFVDVRLQLVDGSYEIHTGDSQYDTDHRGYWGYGSVDCCCRMEQDYREIAIEIVEEALDEYYIDFPEEDSQIKLLRSH